MPNIAEARKVLQLVLLRGKQDLIKSDDPFNAAFSVSLRLCVRYSLELFHQYSQPQSETVPRHTITVRNEGCSRRAITVRNMDSVPTVISWCGTGRMEVLCDYGAERVLLLSCTTMVRTGRWCLDWKYYGTDCDCCNQRSNFMPGIFRLSLTPSCTRPHSM